MRKFVTSRFTQKLIGALIFFLSQVTDHEPFTFTTTLRNWIYDTKQLEKNNRENAQKSNLQQKRRVLKKIYHTLAGYY